MNKYEGIFILKADLPEKELEEEFLKIEDTVKKQEGKIEKSERWGKRRLTFSIKKFHEGFFLYLLFETAPESVKPLNAIFKLNNNILRTQIVRKEK